jgi:hypothetical protein
MNVALIQVRNCGECHYLKLQAIHSFAAYKAPVCSKQKYKMVKKYSIDEPVLILNP